MHGMLSLVILVAAFAAVTGWGIFVSVRLYRTSRGGQPQPASRATRPAPSTRPAR